LELHSFSTYRVAPRQEARRKEGNVARPVLFALKSWKKRRKGKFGEAVLIQGPLQTSVRRK